MALRLEHLNEPPTPPPSPTNSLPEFLSECQVQHRHDELMDLLRDSVQSTRSFAQIVLDTHTQSRTSIETKIDNLITSVDTYAATVNSLRASQARTQVWSQGTNSFARASSSPSLSPTPRSPSVASRPSDCILIPESPTNPFDTVSRSPTPCDKNASSPSLFQPHSPSPPPNYANNNSTNYTNNNSTNNAHGINTHTTDGRPRAPGPPPSPTYTNPAPFNGTVRGLLPAFSGKSACANDVTALGRFIYRIDASIGTRSGTHAGCPRIRCVSLSLSETASLCLQNHCISNQIDLARLDWYEYQDALKNAFVPPEAAELRRTKFDAETISRSDKLIQYIHAWSIRLNQTYGDDMPSHREIFRRLLLALRSRTAVCDYLVSKQHKLIDLPLSESIKRLERWQSETLMQQSLLQRRPTTPIRNPTPGQPTPTPSFVPRTAYGRGSGDAQRTATRAPRGHRHKNDPASDGPKRKFSAGEGATREYQRFADTNHAEHTHGCINCAQLGCADDVVGSHSLGECPDVADWIAQGNPYCMYHADDRHSQVDCHFLRTHNGTVDAVSPK